MDSQQVSFEVEGMSCASCAQHIEKSLKALPGVFIAHINFVTGKAHLEYNPKAISEKDLIEAIQKAGYQAVNPRLSLALETLGPEKEHVFWEFAISALLTLPLFSK